MEVTRKKKIRGGHRASASRTITQIYEAIENPDNPESTLTKLKQCKMALKEKQTILRQWDAEILEQITKDEVEEEIAQADVFTEKVQRVMIDVTNEITMKERPRATITTIPTREPLPSTVDPPSTDLPTTSTDLCFGIHLNRLSISIQN